VTEGSGRRGPGNPEGVPRETGELFQGGAPVDREEPDPEGPGRVRLDLDEPVDAVAPGQAGVLYDGDLVLGGGTVSTTGPM
jgi:hypothetical protein